MEKLNGLMEQKDMVSLKEMTKKKDVFVHSSAARDANLELNEGDALTFEVENGEKVLPQLICKKLNHISINFKTFGAELKNIYNI